MSEHEPEPIKDNILHNLKARSFVIYSRLQDSDRNFRFLILSKENDEMQEYILIYGKHNNGEDVEKLSYLMRKGSFLESYTFDFSMRTFKQDNFIEDVNTDGVAIMKPLGPQEAAVPLNLSHCDLLDKVLYVADDKSVEYQRARIKWN